MWILLRGPRSLRTIYTLSGTSVTSGFIASTEDKGADCVAGAQLCRADAFPVLAQGSHRHGDSSVAYHSDQPRDARSSSLSTKRPFCWEICQCCVGAVGHKGKSGAIKGVALGGSVVVNDAGISASSFLPAFRFASVLGWGRAVSHCLSGGVQKSTKAFLHDACLQISDPY